MRGAVSKGGGNAALADEILVGGQGVRSDPESEGFEEKYRAVIDWGRNAGEIDRLGERNTAAHNFRLESGAGST
jgi:hypothetical protein